jgi:secondary thiamine-phosphate synthase enzyme
MPKIILQTEGFNDIIDITEKVEETIKKSKIEDGIVAIFVVGSTAAITTIEYEPGLIEDIREALEKIAPMKGKYKHEEAWHDGNGYAHIRASLMKPSLSVPIENGKLCLGRWQQIVLIDFDNRPRERIVIVKALSC